MFIPNVSISQYFIKAPRYFISLPVKDSSTGSRLKGRLLCQYTYSMETMTGAPAVANFQLDWGAGDMTAGIWPLVNMSDKSLLPVKIM